MDMLKTGWNFFQNEVLGMAWLNRLIGNLINACGLDATSKIGGSIQFFVYDTIKIMVLLGVLILIISYIQSYFPPERTKKILGRFHGIGANIISALLGTVTPFCSCSSIPLFIGFTSAGLPLGVTFSFLISSPMVDLGSLVLLMSIFGWKIAVAYVVLGLVIAVAGGTLIEKLHLESYVEDFIRGGNSLDVPQEELHFKPYYDNDLVVAKPDGSPISASWVSSQFGKLLEDLDMPHIRFHDLRHTAATNMHQLTGDFYTVGEVLGHTLAGIGVSLGLSMNFEAVTARYVDVRLERKKEVLDAYHGAVKQADPAKAEKAEPKKAKSAAKKKSSDLEL